MVKSRIHRTGDFPVFEINGAQALPYGYMSYQPAKADYAGFRDAGVKLYFTGVYTGDRGINPGSGIKPFRPGIWKSRDVFDFSAVEEDFRLIAGGCPAEGTVPEGLYIIPRLMLEPPTFWEDENPSELARDFGGKSVHQCYSSEKWFADTVRVMEAFQGWLEASGWDAYIAGWHLACGHTEEFMRPSYHPHQMTDYSEHSRLAWQGYVRALYGTVEAMNEAWGTAYGSFEAVEIPSPARRAYPADRFGGERCAMAADYGHFFSVENARAVCRLAHEAKRITGGERVIGAFFGYCGLHNGHTATELVLACPDVDFLASPFSYGYARAPGIDWLVGGPTGSCMLHGKAWFMECDVRTHLSQSIKDCMPFAYPANHHYDQAVWYGPDTEEMSLHQMKKAWARSLCTGCALWWFDMWGGWYRTGAMMEFHAKARELYAEAIRGGLASRSQIAFFRDEREEERYTRARGGELLWPMSQTGAVYTQFLLSDLPAVDPEQYRVIIISGDAFWKDEYTQALKKWMCAGRSVIFAQSREAEAPYFGDGGGVFLPSGENDRVIVEPDCQLYRFAGDVTPAALREAFVMAGAHVYNFTGDVIYAAGDIVAIHAASDGVKRIILPVKGQLEDVFTGERPHATDYFTDMTMAKGETRIFRICQRS